MKRIELKMSEKQKQFMRATCRHVGYGGARGGGKSWSVRAKALLLCLRWPGIKILIVRRTYPELVNNHITPLREMLHGIAEYNDQRKRSRAARPSLLGIATQMGTFCGTKAQSMM